jgi:hypothetical protein
MNDFKVKPEIQQTFAIFVPIKLNSFSDAARNAPAAK